MNNLNIPQISGERLGAKGTILDLIERKAPLMMKVGGYAITRESPYAAHKTTAKDRQNFVKRFNELIALGYTQFKAQMKIAEETGFSSQTVSNYTGKKQRRKGNRV